MEITAINNLSEELSVILDTHDKRWMFLKVFAPMVIGHVNIEGSPLATCREIIDYASKAGCLDGIMQGLDHIAD